MNHADIVDKVGLAEVTVLGGRKVIPPVLTVEESKKSYAKYFLLPMTEPNENLVKQIQAGPLNPDLALPAIQINDLLKPGYLPSEIGYTKLADGTGYVSSIINMPNVTPEMLDWWFAWHPLESLRYKIWNKNVHYGISISDDDREKLTSSVIPWKEKNWNVTHHVIEDIGLGKNEIKIHFVSPAEFGFDMTNFREPLVSTAICSQGGGSRMVHCARKAYAGIELRTRFWFAPEMNVPVEMLKGLNLHAVEEYSHLAQILPMIYKENF